MFGLGMVFIWDSSCLFNPVSLQRIGLVPGNVAMVAIDMYGKAFGSGYMGLRERMYFINFVYYINIKVFHFIYFSLFLFIYLFPFCLHATSALYKPITILFYFVLLNVFEILVYFWNFYVLDVNKNKFYCNIWLYFTVKRL